VDAGTVSRWMHESSASIGEQRDALTALDAAIGDADHGTNMSRGFTAVEAKLADLDGATPGRILTTAGTTLIGTVGGASGPLWGSALRRAGRALGEEETFDADGLVAALEAALQAIVDLGKAEPGDKTMVDALGPAVEALRTEVGAGRPVAEALEAAHAAALAGAEATIPLLAKKGRASYLGERSIGHQDPGATSTAIIVAALQRAVAAEGS
jgi:phosphoenolpyruvate---glycerone phosphotransferase subunit DhaL